MTVWVASFFSSWLAMAYGGSALVLLAVVIKVAFMMRRTGWGSSRLLGLAVLSLLLAGLCALLTYASYGSAGFQRYVDVRKVPG